MNKITEKSVIFENDKKEKIWGVLSLPETRDKIPAVILVHGFKSTKSNQRFVKLGRQLAQNGIAVLRFDFSGCGDSEGEFEEISITKQWSELKRAWEFLAKQPKIDQKRIGLLGHSLGSLIVSLFQSSAMSAKTLILVAPALNQKSLIEQWYTPSEIKEWRRKGYLNTPKGRIGIQYLKETKDYTKFASQIETSTLIIHGEQDEDVPLKYGKETLEALNGEKELHIIKEADHDFESYQAQRELIALSLKWFKEHFR